MRTCLGSTERLASRAGWGRRGWLLAGLVVSLLFAVHSRYRLGLVVGNSMAPGLKTGDLLLVDKQAYRTGQPQRGDVVLARHYQDIIVKRVVGLPGEEVQLTYGQLYINGLIVAEPYAVEPGPLEIGPGQLFEGKYALVGDNRALGHLQTVHAIVPQNRLLGKVVFAFRFWPNLETQPDLH